MTETFAESPGWFRKHFNEDYRTIYAGRGFEQARREAGGIAAALELVRGDHVLDLCCGYGRHLCAFEELGIRAVGADLSRSLLGQIDPALCPRVVAADMRRLPFPGGELGFRAVVSFFTSFGYFDTDEEDLAAAREMARVCCPGGRVALDLMNPEPTLEALEPRTERTRGPFRILELRRHDAGRRRIVKEIELLDQRTDVTRRYVESVRLYQPDEICAALEAAGVGIDRLLGDFDGRPHDQRAPRLIVLGTRARA